MPNVFSQEWAPRVDVSETKDNVVVKAEIPGMEAKDMDVSVSGDVLTIKGEKKKEEEKKNENYHYRERYSGSFPAVPQASCRREKREGRGDIQGWRPHRNTSQGRGGQKEGY